MNIDITPNELNSILQSGQEAPLLLDVREDTEIAICALKNYQHIRLSELPSRFSELPKDKPIVVYCKMGGRSMQAAKFLLQQGFSSVKNLDGGIIRWAEEIDPSMSTY